MTKKPFSYEEFKEIYSKVPRLCVDLIIRTPKGIVLTFRDLPDYKDLWHFPGGTVFYGEEIADAVSRVAKNELNIEVGIIQYLGYMENPNEEKEKGFGHTVSLVILCDAKSENFKLDEQASKVDFFKEVPKNMILPQKDFFEKNLDIIKENIF